MVQSLFVQRGLVRRWASYLVASLLCVQAAVAQTPAVSFPNKPVRIIVPQTPGGASDALARIVGQKLSEKWGQPVVVENRPGAGGNIGMDAVAKAPGDGHTLLMSYVGSHAINPSIYSKLPFDPEADFVAVATLANVPFVAVVSASVPVSNIKALVSYAASKPVSFGSAGNGSVNHLLGEMFNTASGAKMQHVPYKGAAPALTDLISGQIQVVFTSLPSVAGSIKNGSLRPIAVTSGARSSNFPNIPTIAEAGYKEFDVSPWFGLFAPAKTPAAVVRRINQDIQEVLKNKDVIEKFNAQGADVLITQPAEFGALLKNDLAKWGEVVKASGAQID
jgi:tripartite-type tricarboxylate transporter receptor subunit TctC